MATTRRTFLSSAATAAAASVLPATSPAGVPFVGTPPDPMRILVLGGTRFLGPPFVRAALANGHEVTLFNRGKSNPGMFPDLEKLRGDRDKGTLEALEGREFDCVVDTSGYVPAHVAATAGMFANSAKVYQLISSISVYRGFGENTDEVDEGSPVLEIDDETVASIDTIRASFRYYGALKARCEQAAEKAMPGRACNIRPGLIVGPGDASDRFSWWPHRIAQGGTVLAPGNPDGIVQFVDVRDLAAWMLHCLEAKVCGVYNANGFRGRVSMREVLDGCKCATAEPVEFVWADKQFLLDNKVRPYMDMPLWIPSDSRGRVANEAAMPRG